MSSVLRFGVLQGFLFGKLFSWLANKIHGLGEEVGKSEAKRS